MTIVAATSLAAVAVLGGVVVAQQGNDEPAEVAIPAGSAGAAASPEERAGAEALLAKLDDTPVDPTKVKLVRTVTTFADCEGLIGDLRRVGAEHVGSRGFGGYGYGDEFLWAATGYAADGATRSAASTNLGNVSVAPQAGAPGGETIGTNVQVVGVDELDLVKAVGDRIYDFDGKGNLRITSAKTLDVVATLDVTPAGMNADADADEGDENDDGEGDRIPVPQGSTQVAQLLVEGDRVAVFGNEVEVSAPVEGDPSAARASTTYLTVTFVDAADAAKPVVTDRVRVEGSLVSARLVDGEIRLVTTSNMADLGFVSPTSPTSIPKALEQNRRSVALSTAADWIPDWQRKGEAAQPLVPCERVHVPDTFAGVAMTSMVTFPIATGEFEPLATSILAPGDTLYAGLEKVAISSNVWVDPIDRERLEFDDWQTAIHEFSFADGAAPGYEGSGIVDGSTVGQFAFGEIGDSLAVVTTEGVPWKQDDKATIDLTILTPDGDGALDETAALADLADGNGAVDAVRFVEGRVLVSTGLFGRMVQVVDVSDPAAPRRAGSVMLPGSVGYFHPLPDDRALMIGSRSDSVGTGRDERTRQWVQAHLIDVSNPDAPAVVNTWERPWSADQVGADHHAFTYWPSRNLAMWGVIDTNWMGNGEGPPNHAVVLGVDGSVSEVAVPVANKPNEAPSPCPVLDITDPEIDRMIGSDMTVLRCADPATRTVEWPRYRCNLVDAGTVGRLAPEEKGKAAFFTCMPAGQPTVARVLVVDGRPMLLTDQTLEALDPQTWASTAIAYHPTDGFSGIGW